MGEARKAGLIGGALLCGAVIVIAAATAGAGIKTASKSTTIAAQEVGRATADCKRRQRPLSGGFSAEREPIGIFVPAVYPIQSDRNAGGSWGATGMNLGGEEGTLTAFAYCVKGGRTHPEGGDFIRVSPGESVSDVAKCPKGQRVVSGGFSQFNGDNRIAIHESRRVGQRKWRVSGHNYGSGFNPEFAAQAYCSERHRRLKTRSKTVDIEDPLTVGTVTARCGKGSTAISGGFSNPSFDAAHANQTQAAIAESRRAGRRGWIASAPSMLGPATLTGYVYCQKK